MLKPTLITLTVGLMAAFIAYSAFAANDNDGFAQKYQSMINKAYNNALNSTKPVTPPDNSKAAISSGQNALMPTAPAIPAVAAPPPPSQTPTVPSAQPPVSAPPPSSLTNPNAGGTSAGPPNIFITPGASGNSNSQNRSTGSNNVIHY